MYMLITIWNCFLYIIFCETMQVSSALILLQRLEHIFYIFKKHTALAWDGCNRMLILSACFTRLYSRIENPRYIDYWERTQFTNYSHLPTIGVRKFLRNQNFESSQNSILMLELGNTSQMANHARGIILCKSYTNMKFFALSIYVFGWCHWRC
jgi:hypothetical protein